MKRKLAAVGLVLGMLVNQCVTTSANVSKPDVLRGIFSGIDAVDPDEKSLDLPYVDGTVLSDIREPMYISSDSTKILGESSFASDDVTWKNDVKYTMKKTSVTFGGKTYSIGDEYKLLHAAEADFDGDGKKGELGILAAARATDKTSLLLLCASSAKNRDGKVNPISVLYSGTEEFYDNLHEFENCLEIVCADLNGDGYDEIVTATPTGGIGERGNDKYKLDKFGGAYLWSQNESSRGGASWQTFDGWNQTPDTFGIGLSVSYGENCIMGAPGTTASLAADDIDGDGYDDIAAAFSTTKAKFNANYSGNQYSVYYVGGAPTLDEMYYKRNALMKYIGNKIEGDDINLSIASGDAAGFDVDICDVDKSGKPTIFLSFKKTIHHWAAMSGTKMFTPSFYIYSFDMNDNKSSFTASLVHRGGIYHHGWMGGGSINDTDYVYRTDTIDCAPIRLGVLKGDFGLSDGKTGYASSGTIVADQRYFSFVRYPDGNKYKYDIVNSGSYTGTWGAGRDDNGQGFADDDCVFYNNGINVTDVKTANIRYDDIIYEDAALVSAYTKDGFKTYCLMPNGNGYGVSELGGDDTAFAAVATPDTDNDSIHLKYNKHRFFWADPVIIAALASPPYFDSLPSDMYSNSQTTYGKSRTASTGKSQSYTVSAGSYVSTEIKGGGGGVSGVFEAESEAMKNLSSQREDSTEISYTQSFSASGGEDTVVLSTVAYDAYSYTAVYPGADGKLAESPYIVYVPRGGSDAIRIASLSYRNYLEFAKYAEGALPDLSNVFTHTVGKPETYPHTVPTGSNVLSGSIMTHSNVAGFPTDTSSQTLSMDITNETSETTSSGSSISVKLGGGFEAEADDIFGFVNYGSKITIGSSSEKEYESGRIMTSAVGTSFEGTVFGQGDGMNVSGGSEEKAYFNWRLLHYINNFKSGNNVLQFPVVTYITSGVIQPSGVVPTSLSVSPAQMTVEQVGPKTVGYVNEVGFTANIDGISRDAYTALEGAPFGMTLNTGGSNIGRSGAYPFGIRINSNVLPGEYELKLNVGGKLSNPFKVIVNKYTEPVWIEADKDVVDFGSMRYKYSGGTPSADAQTITIKNIHTEQISNLVAEVDENSDFEITEDISSNLLYAKDLQNSTATIKVAPKSGLDVGVHVGTLKVTNGVTSAFVTLKYTVSAPVAPQAPYFQYTEKTTPNPVKLHINAPDDDGGGKMLHYLYTIKEHDKYVKDGIQVWKKSHNTAQSGFSFYLNIEEELDVGKKYTIGVKAVTNYGESQPAWHEFEVCMPPNDPDPVKNVKVYPSDGGFSLTWDAPDYWGENEYYPDIKWKLFKITFNTGKEIWYMDTISINEDLQWNYTGPETLENGKEYEVTISSSTVDRETPYTVKVIPTADIIPPSRPSDFKAEMSYKTAELSWKAPSYIGEKAVTYEVSKDGGENWTETTNLQNDRYVYTFENLVTNCEYNFKVRAVNSKGPGDCSTLTKTAPSNLAEPLLYSVVRGYEQLELIWYDVEDESVVGYEAKLDDGEWIPIEPIKYDGVLHYIFTGLENEKEYTLNVRAVNSEGGGKELTQIRKPCSIAPQPPINPHVEPLNGGIKIYGQKHNSYDTLEYKLDGSSYWWSFNETSKLTGLENGKEHIVAISTSGRDENRMTVRSTVYLKVTPDESIPNEPKAPILKTYIGDDYVRMQWSVEDDGGAPIEYYEISFDGEEPLVLPASETSILINRSDINKEYGSHFSVTAYNSVGSSSESKYLYFSEELDGTNNISLTNNRDEDFSTSYSLFRYEYVDEDESGNPIFEKRDISDSEYVTWSFEANNDKLTWDDTSKSIVADRDLSEGIYNVVVRAELNGIVYEKNVIVTIGNPVRIVLAVSSLTGVSVQLDLPSELGDKLLAVSAYEYEGKLLESVMQKISYESLTDGKVTVPINCKDASFVKVMLYDKIGNLRPLCKSVSIYN